MRKLRPLSAFPEAPEEGRETGDGSAWQETACSSSSLRLLKNVLAKPHCMWDLGSLTRDRTSGPCIGSTESNYWTMREAPLRPPPTTPYPRLNCPPLSPFLPPSASPAPPSLFSQTLSKAGMGLCGPSVSNFWFSSGFRNMKSEFLEILRS